MIASREGLNQASLDALSDKTLIIIAQEDLSKIKNESEVVDQALLKALDNFDFIEKLAQLLAVKTVLRRTGKTVKILGGNVGDPYKPGSQLRVGADGIFTNSEHERRNWGQLRIRRIDLELGWNDSMQQGNSRVVNWMVKLGQMTKEDIIKKFEKAIKV